MSICRGIGVAIPWRAAAFILVLLLLGAVGRGVGGRKWYF
jgi:hypothetical protein